MLEIPILDKFSSGVSWQPVRCELQSAGSTRGVWLWRHRAGTSSEPSLSSIQPRVVKALAVGFGAEMTALKNQIVSVTNLNRSVRVGFALGFVCSCLWPCGAV